MVTDGRHTDWQLVERLLDPDAIVDLGANHIKVEYRGRWTSPAAYGDQASARHLAGQ